jgi:hypothetical protein
MLKYLTILLVLLAMGGRGTAQTPCAECYPNIITQTDTQTIQDVRLGSPSADDPNVDTVAVGNEGLSAAVIVTPASVDPVGTSMYSKTGFARIDQAMTQTISGLGSATITPGDPRSGAKGITWNKAIQAAWIVNQGQKENDTGIWEKEGAYIAQTTTQNIMNVFDYDGRESAKVLNVDNKLAMIVDDVKAIVNLTANANSQASDDQASYGTIENDVNITIAGKDP